MNGKRIVSFLLALITLGVFASCRNKQTEESTGELSLPETLEAIAPDKTLDYTEDEELYEVVETLRASFRTLAETPAEQFSVLVANGTATVTGYLGTDEKIRVPEAVNGVPVTAIGDAAFAGRATLKSLYLPDSVTSVGEGILKGCTALTSLRTPLLSKNASSKQYLGYLFGATTYTDNPLCVPATLTYLELGGSSSALADFALFDCNDLLCVTLPESMTTLGVYSLYQCSSLLAINTEHLTEMREHALDACSSLTRLDFGASMKKIGLGALEGCISLRTLTLPFVGGSKTENRYLGYIFGATVPDFAKGYYPKYLSELCLLSSCTSLGDYAFYEMEALSVISLPQMLTSIGVRAFSGCKRLTAIALPATLITIRENAFFGCVALKALTFAEGCALQTVGINAFYFCTALTSAKLPDGLQSLPASCFAGCVSLAQIDLGGVTAVGKNAFRHCDALVSLTAKGNVTFEAGNDAAQALQNPTT